MKKELLQQTLEVLLMNPEHPEYSVVRGKAIMALHTAIAQPADSTPNLHVGNSKFESWYESGSRWRTGDKQLARDAYAAGMSDALVTYAQPAQSEKSCYCDKRGIGVLGVSCGDCPIRDYKPAQPAVSDTDRALERYMTANYPDAKGATLAERVIDALETMDIDLGMREIAQPATANFLVTESHIELLATMLHFVPIEDRQLASDLSAFTHTARAAIAQTAVSNAALPVVSPQPAVNTQAIRQCVDIFDSHPGKNLAETLYKIAFAAYRAGQEAPTQGAPAHAATCIWTDQDDNDMPNTYAAACGELWSFVDGGVSENNFKYCHVCGKPVEVAATEGGQS